MSVGSVILLVMWGPVVELVRGTWVGIFQVFL